MLRLFVAPVLAACGPVASVESGSATGATNDASEGDGSTTRTSLDSSSSITVGAPDSGTSPDDGPATTFPTCDGFICATDSGGVNIECDVWAQDCPVGQKCMPWANDGGSGWNATRCSPIDPAPVEIGEPCTVVGSGASGIDDCPIAAMCWDVDPETMMGRCVGLCEGSEANPLCADPSTGCILTDQGVLILCLPMCDPLAQDCWPGEACYPVNESFYCEPDASGEQGAYGEPCVYINACDVGLWCANADAVPGCEGSQGCCSEFCDLAAADPDAECAGVAEGQVCVPWYELGQAPPMFVDVGVCALPR